MSGLFHTWKCRRFGYSTFCSYTVTSYAEQSVSLATAGLLVLYFSCTWSYRSVPTGLSLLTSCAWEIRRYDPVYFNSCTEALSLRTKNWRISHLCFYDIEMKFVGFARRILQTTTVLANAGNKFLMQDTVIRTGKFYDTLLPQQS